MPPFINEPTVYNETDSVRITCRSNATPRPSRTTWERNGVKVSTNALLTFNSIDRSNTSVYTCCTVREVAGESTPPTCSNFTIIVQCEYLSCMIYKIPTCLVDMH